MKKRKRKRKIKNKKKRKNKRRRKRKRKRKRNIKSYKSIKIYANQTESMESRKITKKTIKQTKKITENHDIQ